LPLGTLLEVGIFTDRPPEQAKGKRFIGNLVHFEHVTVLLEDIVPRRKKITRFPHSIPIGK
jgi:hypothetical protein